MSDDRPSRAVRVRRSPKIGVFLALGLVLGLIAAFIVTVATSDDGRYSVAQVFAYVALIFAPAGAAVTGLIAVVLDRISVRRARIATADLETIRHEPAGDADEPGPALDRLS